MLQIRRILLQRKTLQVSIQNYSVAAASETYTQRKSLYGSNFPDKLLSKKHKTPEHFYLTNVETAQEIDKLIAPYLKRSKCDTVLEINPGIGLLTHQLLKHKKCFRNIILFETLEYFMPQLLELQRAHPERLLVQRDDFINISKVAYQDKMDNGTRINELLRSVPKRAFNDDCSTIVIGAVGAYNFFQHLVNSLVFQNGLLTWGRFEMFLMVPPPIYIHLTSNNEIGYLLYRSASMLFQILFEYQFIAQVPREHFLPKQSQYNAVKGSKLRRVKSINPEFLYLVRIVPRRNLLDLCPLEDLPALWYFVKQNCVSRRNRIIPNLEKLIPGCGPRLIMNKEKSEPAQQLYADDDQNKLPQYSKVCTTMGCRDFYPNINIFTQFGDLSASQMLTLFTQFRSWPEYADSTFIASLENSMLKMETLATENIIGLTEEDDVVSDIIGLDDAMSIEEEIKAMPKRKKKPKTVK